MDRIRSFWPKFFSRFNNGSFYRRSLLLVLLIASLPSGLIALGSYFIGVNQIEQEVNRTHQQRLSQVSDAFANKFSRLELLMARWASTTLFENRLNSFEPLKDYPLEVNEIMQSLAVISSSDELIEEVQVYLESEGVLLSNEEGITYLKEETQRLPYRSLLQQRNGFVWHVNQTGTESGTVLTDAYLVFKLPYYAVEPFGTFLVKLKRTSLHAMIRSWNPGGTGPAFLLDHEGDWLVNGDQFEVQNPRPIDIKLREAVLKTNANNQTFTFTFNGETYSVTSGTLQRPEWRYVLATPLSQLTAPVKAASTWILLVNGIGMLIAVLLSWIASRKLYRPIRRMLNVFKASKDQTDVTVYQDEVEYMVQRWRVLSQEKEVLENRLEEALPALRDGFILQLIQGHLSGLPEHTVITRLEQMGWDLDGRMYALLLLQISGFSLPTSKFRKGDETLAFFAAHNIAEELAVSVIDQAKVIDFQDTTLGVLVAFPKGNHQNYYSEVLYPYANQTMKTMNKILGLHITLCVGRPTSEIGMLSMVLDENRQTLKYRHLHEPVQILDVETLRMQGNSEVYHPFELEKEILQALKMGIEEDVYSLIDQFVDKLYGQVSTEFAFHQGLQQLLGKIHELMLQAGFNPYLLFGGDNMPEQLRQLKEPADIADWFNERIVRIYMNKLEESTDLHYKKLVEQVILYIHEHYTEDISLEQCADKHNTNPYTLSRAFRQIHGINFIDYLTELRLDKSKELLAGTDLKISDVAKGVGYQQTYFNRVFKRYVGLTPSQFREKYKA